eukprot:JP447935.1.p1 GENE.JP447935.1~~JP447935.1.p1  ORF type:complete len:127 (+),score=29.00 JP447935.1:30-383(+)
MATKATAAGGGAKTKEKKVKETDELDETYAGDELLTSNMECANEIDDFEKRLKSGSVLHQPKAAPKKAVAERKPVQAPQQYVMGSAKASKYDEAEEEAQEAREAMAEMDRFDAKLRS